VKLLKIGELAKRTGKSVRAIRFYEELGLIQSASHTKGGFRLFEHDDVRKIGLVDKFHQLGFSLEEISQIVRAFRTSGTGDEAQKKLRPMLEKTLQTIQEKTALLETFKHEVENSLHFISDCKQCQAQPAETQCTSCCRGQHTVGSVPPVINAILK
jgi:DNA-binding transcriptional MerR regulator